MPCYSQETILSLFGCPLRHWAPFLIFLIIEILSISYPKLTVNEIRGKTEYSLMHTEYSEYWIQFYYRQLLWKIRHFIIYRSLHICYLQQSCGRRNAGRAGKACGVLSVCHIKWGEEFYPQYGKSAQPPEGESGGTREKQEWTDTVH